MNSNVGLLVCTDRVCIGQRLLRYIYIAYLYTYIIHYIIYNMVRNSSTAFLSFYVVAALDF